MSLVWRYFRLKRNDVSKVVCLVCFPCGEGEDGELHAVKFLSRGAKTKSFSTKPMWNHLRCMHAEEHEILFRSQSFTNNNNNNASMKTSQTAKEACATPLFPPSPYYLPSSLASLLLPPSSPPTFKCFITKT